MLTSYIAGFYNAGALNPAHLYSLSPNGEEGQGEGEVIFAE